MDRRAQWLCGVLGFVVACSAIAGAEERATSGKGAGAATAAATSTTTVGWPTAAPAAKPAKAPDRAVARAESSAAAATKPVKTASAQDRATSGWGSGAAATTTTGWPAAAPAAKPAKAPKRAVARAESSTAAATKPVKAASAVVAGRNPEPAVHSTAATAPRPRVVLGLARLTWPDEIGRAPSPAFVAAPVVGPVAKPVVVPPGVEPAIVAPPSGIIHPVPTALAPIERAAAGPFAAVGPAPAEQRTIAPAGPAAGPRALVAPSARRPLLARWLDLQAATMSSRYRFVENSQSVMTNSQLQHNEGVKARLRLDAAGLYSVNVRLASGSSFTSGWNNAGVGTPGDFFTRLYVKDLFFAAVPAKGIELLYGGLSPARGENTEITSYDNDAYIVGERVIVKRPAALYFDEISATRAYLGDLTTPSFMKRYQRLDETNYHQLLVAKKFGRRLTTSFDYTATSGIATMRSAFTVKAAESRVVDLVRVEGYRRLNNSATGFAVYGEKVLTKWATVGGGWADIDNGYGGLNADRFNKGRRLFANGTVTVMQELSVQLFYQHAVANNYTMSNRSRLDVILAFNVLKALQRGRVF
jgi:hypothetical protein